MAKKLLDVKKLNTLMLSALIMSQQTFIPAALASNITDVTPTGNTYNINPSKVNGDVGFRHYTNFELDKGDIANLIFKSGATNIEQFVNLVDNKIQINGILNTMRDNAFYNGHAVFVSPNGMVVGASGVLNVGSLTAIAPTTNNYLRYVGTSFDSNIAKNAADNLGVNPVSINADTTITLAGLMKGDMGGDITVNGKILARGDVNLFAKNIAVAGDKSANEGNQQAAIVAGIPTTYDEIITTNERAGQIFNALVGTDAQNGTGFTRDEKGNIVIQAQSIKEDETGSATVRVADAKIAGKNIDINAVSTSEKSYVTVEGAPLYGSDSATDDDTEALLDNLTKIELDSDIDSSNEYKFKGARAAATVTIDSGAELIADENISIRALAEAETKAKGYEVISYYNYGVQTGADVTIKDGATLTAGKDINVDALTRNILNIEIDGKGSEIVDGVVQVLKENIPNIQVEILKTNVVATTNAEVEQGAVLTAGNDVNVEALNVTDSSARVESEAWINPPENGKEQSSAAITLNFTNTQIDTTASVGGEVYAKDLLVSAQSVNTASNAVSSYSGVRTMPSAVQTLKTRFEGKIAGILSNNLSGLSDAIDSYVGSFNSALPSVSVALVVNNSNINTKAQVANTAKISVSNDLNIVANTIDKTINASDSSCRMPVGTDGTTGDYSQYKVAPGVAVIVTNQTNNTTAIIEDGTVDNHAVISAGDTITVNATTEVPRNDAPEQLILGFKNLALDTIAAFKGENGSVTEALNFELGENLEKISSSFEDMGGINTLGLQGIFNNWAASSSYNSTGAGIAASVVASTLKNVTTAKIGNYTVITPPDNSSSSPDVKVNAANSVTQYNAAGDILKFWQLPTSAGSKYGMGGEVIVQDVTNDAKAIIGNNADIKAKDINLNSATNQDYLTMSMIYGISGGDGGLSIDGSVIVQDFQGTTESAIGASTINADNLTIKAGEADIQLAPTAKEDIAGSENSDLDGSMSVDNDTGILQGDAILTTLKESETIQDSISNLVISGAIARQKDKNPSEGQTSSSGVAAGAAVNVGIIERTVRASIADAANITLSNSLAVNAETSSEALYIAVAGAQAGGVKTEDWISKTGAALESAANKIKGKIQGAFDGMAGALLQDNQITNTGSLDDNGNPIVKMNGTKYTTNANGEYVDSKGNILKDSSGNAVKAQSLDGKASTTTPTLDNQNTTNAKNTMSAALAGALNIQLNDSTVESTVGKANIKVGNSVEVTAEQSTQALNIGGGAATAETVGAGAAVNVIKNSNITSATVDGAKITYTVTGTGDDSNKLNVKAVENNDNIQVAIGIGMASDKSQNGSAEGSSGGSSTSVAAGGSFNTDYLTNSVSAEVKNATINNENPTKNNIEINVAADNYSTSYKGAGGLSKSSKNSGTGVGAGIAGNLNIIKKQTTARIENSSISNASQIEVVANKDAGEDKKTENLISVGLSAAATSGGESSYTFEGTMGTDCIDNTIIAEITGSTIDTAGNIDVAANNSVFNWNAAGALGFSSSSKGVGAGVGAIVNILDNDVIARIDNSIIKKAIDVKVNASNKENLNLLAVNFGVQTQSGNAVGVNGVVNVVKNTMNASVIDSTITNSDAMNVISDYDTNITGVTAVAEISNSGAAVGANIVVNTLLSENIANIEGSTVTSNGDLTLSANSNENITLTPATIAASISGNFAAAANIEVNTVSNTTKAYIDKAVKNDKDILSTISAKSIRVTASDITQTRSRGGVLAAGLDGNAIGGSISSDVFLKNVEAYIDNAVITNGGDVSVEATAQNIFGAENPSSITISGVTDQLTAGNDVSGIHYFDKWDMTYDVSGSSQASVAGSLISKVVANDVNSYIGSNTKIQEAGKIGISASNETSSAAIIGNIAGSSGSAAVGASIFSNVNASNVSAGINNGAKIGTLSNVGDISINAKSSQEYHSINLAVTASSASTAVNGSIISNIVVNETNAYIDKNVTINSSGALTVKANDSMEVEQVQCAVAGASSAAVGAMVDVNILSNNVNSVIGRNDDSDTSKSGSLNFAGDVSTTAQSSEDVEINVIMVAGSGDASVSGVVISNTLASGVNSGIEETNLISDREINVAAKNSYNEKNKDKTNGIGDLIKDALDDSDDNDNTIEASDLTPIVSVLNIAGSGTAAVGGTVVNNNVITGVNSYIRNAVVEGTKINLDSDSIMTTYDAVMGIAGSSTAAVATTGVVNTYAGTTNAEISVSTISGNTSLNADDTFNLNSVIFSVAGTGTGAAITAVVDVNTISNNVLAQVIDSTITADTVDIKSTNTINISDIIAAGQGSGTGASVGVVPITNVFNGTTTAGISKTTIDGAKLTVDASDDVNISNIVLGVSGAGVGASVGGYALTNVFNNTLNAYISDSTIKNGQSTSVNAQADFDMVGILMSGGFTGSGAAVCLNGLTNVVNNTINSYIANSSISGGSVSVTSSQDSTIYSTTGGIAGNGTGNATVVNAITNVITNNLNAYIDNTSTDGTSTITVSTTSNEDFENINMGVSISGTASNSANTLVNVLENNSHAYIDAKSKTMNTTGKITVKSEDTIQLRNTIGLIAASVTEAAGANVNVNIINNAVKAEILSATGGKITAKGVDVAANSIIAMKDTVVTGAVGVSGAGIAGTVIVNSIGDRYTNSSDELKYAGIDKALTNANDNYDGTAGKSGNAPELLLGTSSKQEGTVANISANITSSDAINVTAENVVKGYDSDTLKITNATVSGGVVGAGVGILVTDMDYNTRATISGGKVETTSGDINVKASNTVKAQTNAVEAAFGVVAIGGNVAYFNNSANTVAQIDSATVNSANNLNVIATSVDNIVSNAISAKISGVSVAVSVAVAQTSNLTQALISGTNVDIYANDINIKAGNTSSLTSKMYCASIGSSVTASVLVNKAQSSSVTSALISATSGTVDALGALNITSETGGISVKNNVVLGSAGFASLSANTQFANAAATFNSGIQKGTTVKANSVKIKSGTKTDTDNAGVISAVVEAVEAKAGAVSANATYLDARANAVSNAYGQGTVTSSTGIDIISAINRTATVESKEYSVSGLELGGLGIVTTVGGSTNIDTSGGDLTAVNGNINLTATSVNNSKANSSKVEVALGKAGVYILQATTSSGSTVNLGNMTASKGDIKAEINNTLNANLGSSSKGVSLINVGSMTMTAETSGESAIKGSGTATAKNVTYTVNSIANADAKMESGSIELVGGNGTTIGVTAGSNAKITSGSINATNVTLDANATRKATITDKQKSLSLGGLKITNLNTTASGTTGVTTSGTIQNKAGDGNATKVEISSTDKSSAENDSATSSLSFVEGSSLNITSKVNSSISNTIGGTIKGDTVSIKSTLDRSTVANATSSSAGLVDIGVMNLTSQIDNGATTTLNGTINSNNLTVNSNMNNHVETYVKDFSAGLVALAYGEAKNTVNSTAKNIINYNGTISTGSISSTIDTVSQAELFKESKNYGIFVIKGGKLTNALNAGSEMNFNNSKITTTGDASFSVKNSAQTPQEMQVTDDSGGFIVSSGANLNNNISIGSSMNFNASSNSDTLIESGGALDLNISSGTSGFKQYVVSKGSGFSANNKASSAVAATINNAVNLNSGKVIAKNLNVNLDSSNTLSSRAEVEARHFAGSPSVSSTVALTINNTVNVGGELYAQSNSGNTDDTNVNINFMHNSVQDITQYANLYAEAAVASGSASGGITFNTNNKVNVKSGGAINSQKDINIIFDKGTENLKSTIEYDKISRILFGIKIHDSDTYDNITNTSKNEAIIDGTLTSGKNSSMSMVIDKNGNATNTSIKEGTHYTKVDTSATGSDEAAVDAEVKRLTIEIGNLEDERQVLLSEQDVTLKEYNDLVSQIDSLTLKLAIINAAENLEADAKISQSEFSDVILGILKANNVKDAENYVSQLLDFISLPSSDNNNTFFYATEQNGSGIISFVAEAESEYKKDSYGNYLLDGYSYQYDDNGRLKTDSNGNILVSDAKGNEVTLYSFTMDDYINATIEFENSTSDTPQNALISALQEMKGNIKSTEIEVKVGETTQSVKMLTYNDKVIYDDANSETAKALQSILEASNDKLEIVKANLTELADNITDLNESIAADKALIADIQENGLAMDVQNGTYYFNPINATSGTITIKSNKGSSKVSGSGTIKMAIADILINNYSNYNLVFSDLTIGGGNGSLNIDNQPISNNPYNGITITTTGSDNKGGITINNWYDHNDPANNNATGVLPSNITFNGKVTTKDGNVTIYNESGDVNINNVIDAKKVTITVPQGSLTQNTYGKTYTLAAGDTLFAGKDINITASNFIIEGTMQAGVANKNITITEDMITNAVPETYLKEKIGSDGNVVVDADGNVVYDEVSTGRLLLNLSYGRSASEGTKLSDYMYDTNNIKAVWDPVTNTIELFGVQVTDKAGIYLTSSGYNASDVSASNAAIYIADTATLKYANGYGTIKIDNQTDYNLKVNAVENNYITGDITYTYKDNSTLKASENNLPKLGSYTENTYINFLGLKLPIWSTEKYYGVSSKAKLTNTAASNPKTGKITIDTSNSKGDLDIQGLISSGNLTADKSGLELTALGNINILNRLLSAESTSQAATIQTLGDIVISNTQNSTGSINIDGLIDNSGNITVTNNGSGDININQTGSIKNKNGEVKLTNNKGSGININDGKISNDSGEIKITNLSGGITTSEKSLIQNNSNISITNKGSSGMSLGGAINATKGNVDITNNSGNLDILSTANIDLNKGYLTNENSINIKNTQDAGAMTIAGTIANNGIKDINITNESSKLLLIDSSADVTAANGDINITNTNTAEGSGTTIKGSITDKNGNINITNDGVLGTTISGAITDENGNIEVVNNNGKLQTSKLSVITNNDGNTKITSNGADGAELKGKITNKGNVEITNTKNSGNMLVAGTITNNGNTNITNKSEAGTTISGTVSNKNGNIEIESTAGQFKLTDSGVIENNRGNETQTKDEDIKITNSGSGLLSFLGQIFNRKGKTEITNTNEKSGIELGVTVAEDSSEVTHRGSITNESGVLAISNAGTQGLFILGDVVSNGSTTIDNTATGIYIATVVTNNDTVNKGTITTTGGLKITNSGSGGIDVAGDVVNTNGDLIVDNNAGGVVVDRTYTSEGSFVNGRIENFSEETNKLLIQNSGDEGIVVKGDIVNSKNGDLTIENNNTNNSGIVTSAESLISQNNGTLNITNEGSVGIELAGAIENTKGVTNITNNNISGGIELATTGSVTNCDGNVNVTNIGSKGIDIEGLVSVENQNIVITNKNSNLEIGEYESDNDYYLSTANGNIIINQTNGNVINGITDIDNDSNQNQDLANPDKAYKTLISTSNDLIVNVDGGNFGSDANALSGKESGFGVNASTRDYTDSINVNVGNTITANATNNGDALINVRAKESDLKINTITSDGNVMITVADWKQADTTTASGEDYYVGYSVLNASEDSSLPNITARNISVISSNNIGSEDTRLTYNQLPDGTVSMMAENNIYAEGLADKDNVWQLIAKQGNADVIFNGDAEIREVTAGTDLNLISKGSELTIYDIGKTPNLTDSDDILNPHDNLALSTGVIPDTINLAVLNINENTKQETGGTISIYNALVEGTNSAGADVTLIGDNIIANAYEAPSSPVATPANPNGFDATVGRTYSNDFTDSNSENNLTATGFTTSGQGSALVFDIQGVSPDAVAQVGGNLADRTYNSQDSITAEQIFTNPNGFVDTVYKANNVTLSLNSSANASDENRGLLINTIYADNAYVDTKDLNLNVTDAFITDYAEFKNGNLGGNPNAPTISDDYRYSVIVDNTTARNVGANYNIPVSAQLYTAKTGSFALNLGDSITIETMAPVVLYDPNVVINSPNIENSFYRLTYKEDKLQNATTLKSFRDNDKDTYKLTKREFIRFNMENTEELVSITEHNIINDKSRVISVLDISRGGVLVSHDGSLKEHEKFVIDLTCYDITVSPEVEVIYLSENRAGLKFINLNDSTANKILYINMSLAKIKTDAQMSKL